MKNKANMYLMCGCSGSGKTTYAKELAETLGIEYIGVDDFYALVNGDECIHKNKFDVWMKFWQAIHDLEVAGKSCVIDTNALTIHQRKEFVEWFPTFEHHLIYIGANIKLRVENNKKRKRKVPDSVMDEMTRKLEIPTLGTDRDFVTITHIRNENNMYKEVIIFERECKTWIP